MKYNYYFGRQLKFNKYFSTIINKKNKIKKITVQDKIISNKLVTVGLKEMTRLIPFDIKVEELL